MAVYKNGSSPFKRLQEFFNIASHKKYTYSDLEVFIGRNRNFDTFRKSGGFDFSRKCLIEHINGKDMLISVSNITNQHLINHITGANIYKFNIYEYSKMVIFEIKNTENENTLEVVRKLHSYLGYGFFAESSVCADAYKMNYKIYYKFEEYIKHESLRDFVNMLNQKHNYIVHFYDRKSEPVILPFSPKMYQRIDYLKHKYKSKNPLVDFDLDIKIKYELATMLFYDAYHQPVPTILETETLKEKIRNYNFNPYNQDIKMLNNFSYNNKNKFDMRRLIAHTLISYNVLDYDRFEYECLRWKDKECKDIDYIEPRKAILHKIWKECLNRFGNSPRLNTHTDKFLVNENIKLPKKIEKQLIEIFNYEYRNQNVGKEDGKCQKQFIQDCLNIITAMFAIQRFRKYSTISYNSKEFSVLENGIPLGKELQQKIAKHYGIKDISKRIKFLIKIQIIYVLHTADGYSYSYKRITFVKHFAFGNITKIFYKIRKSIKKFISLSIEFINLNNVSNFFNINNSFNDNYSQYNRKLLLNIHKQIE